MSALGNVIFDRSTHMSIRIMTIVFMGLLGCKPQPSDDSTQQKDSLAGESGGQTEPEVDEIKSKDEKRPTEDSESIEGYLTDTSTLVITRNDGGITVSGGDDSLAPNTKLVLSGILPEQTSAIKHDVAFKPARYWILTSDAEGKFELDIDVQDLVLFIGGKIAEEAVTLSKGRKRSWADPKYYKFTRTLEAYKKTMPKGEFILSTESDFLRLKNKQLTRVF